MNSMNMVFDLFTCLSLAAVDEISKLAEMFNIVKGYLVLMTTIPQKAVGMKVFSGNH